MISEILFTSMIAMFWLAEFAFGAVVVYWFLIEGLGDDQATTSGPARELEDRSYTLRSLAMWASFFIVLIIVIIVGA